MPTTPTNRPPEIEATALLEVFRYNFEALTAFAYHLSEEELETVLAALGPRQQAHLRSKLASVHAALGHDLPVFLQDLEEVMAADREDEPPTGEEFG